MAFLWEFLMTDKLAIRIRQMMQQGNFTNIHRIVACWWDSFSPISLGCSLAVIFIEFIYDVHSFCVDKVFILQRQRVRRKWYKIVRNQPFKAHFFVKYIKKPKTRQFLFYHRLIHLVNLGNKRKTLYIYKAFSLEPDSPGFLVGALKEICCMLKEYLKCFYNKEKKLISRQHTLFTFKKWAELFTESLLLGKHLRASDWKQSSCSESYDH